MTDKTRDNEKSKLARNQKLLVKAYVDEQKTVAEIANKLGLPETTVHRWLKKSGVIFRPRMRRTISTDVLVVLKQDYKDGMSYKALCNKHNIKPHNLDRALKRAGVVRNRNTGRDPAVILNVKKDYLQGYKHREIAARNGIKTGTVPAYLKASDVLQKKA